MRLLPEREKQALLDEICTYARKSTDFLITDCSTNVKVISGVNEGLYGWLAANYLLGGFDDPEAHDHGKDGHHTYGFLDMGGASAQIAFAPNATEVGKHWDDLTHLRMRRWDGKDLDYDVFVTTWLGYGMNEARKRYVAHLVDASGGTGVTELPDPCLPKGLRENLDGSPYTSKDGKTHLIGTGNFKECERQAFPLLAQDLATPCVEAPCLLKNHVPAIDFDVNHFVGVSEFWHTTHDKTFAVDCKHPAAYDFATYQNQVVEFCSQDWETISASIGGKKCGKKFNADTAAHICFKASWVINMLHEGIGIPRVGLEPTPKDGHNGTLEVIDAAKEKGFVSTFQAVDEIDDTELSWTLGAMLLYTADRIPVPAGTTALPIGFGPNAGSEWTHAGPPTGSKPMVPIPTGSNYTMEPHWHDSIWREGDSAPRRIPGIVLFMIIFTVAAFLLLGRERRARLFRRGRLSRNILGGGSGGMSMYERVMEEGGDRVTSPVFELTDVDSDDNSGWMRNKLHAGKGNLYDPFEPSAAMSTVRSGLGERTGSRERLSSSRAVSPHKSMRRGGSYSLSPPSR